jgi:CRISPR system Cascade subunit CasC
MSKATQSSQPNLFVEFHALVSHAPSNLNRDDLGSPKSCVFGGVRRVRISSQCLKRAWRTSEWFRGTFAEDQLGIRTSTVPELVLEALKKSPLSDGARAGLLALFQSLGKKDKKATEQEDDDESGDGEEQAAEAEKPGGGKAETAHLLFVTREEVEALVAFAKAEAKELEKVYKPAGKGGKLAKDSEALKKVRKDLKAFMEERCTRNAVDVALFGRFLTSDEFAECDAAMQVAHAIGTEPAEITYDYFTAVDDLSQEAGAGHLGETELASSVFYKYAVCDLQSLASSLSRGSKALSQSDVDLAAKAMGAMAQAIARTVPSGKRNSTAPQSPADYLEIVVRRNAPISLANAFLKPVRPREDRDVMEVSIQNLREYSKKLEEGYSGAGDVIARFVLSFRDTQLHLGETEIKRFADLAPRVESELKKALKGASA